MAAFTSSIKEVAEFKIELDASLGVDIANVTVRIAGGSAAELGR
jgi:hypothetical protein